MRSENALGILRQRIRRIARTGRLRASEERVVDLVQAMGVGTVLTLLQKPPAERDGLSEAAWDTVLAAIPGGGRRRITSGHGPASALRASLDQVAGLTPGGMLLLDELLPRIAQAR